MKRTPATYLLPLAASLLMVSAVYAAGDAAVGLPRTLGGRTAQGVIGELVRNALGLSGVAALAVFVYAGIRYLTSQGNEETITKSKNMMVWAALGLVVLFASYSIVSFIQKQVSGATGVTTKTEGGAAPGTNPAPNP